MLGVSHAKGDYGQPSRDAEDAEECGVGGLTALAAEAGNKGSVGHWEIPVSWEAAHQSEGEEEKLLTISTPLQDRRGRLAAFARAFWDSGAACIQLAAVSYSFGGVFIKLLSHLSVFQISFARSAPCFLITCILAKLFGIQNVLGPRDKLPILALRGFVGSAALIFFYMGMMRLPLADAVTLFFTNAALTAILGWLLRLEKINWKLGVGIVSCTIGTVLVAHPPFLFGGHRGWGHTRVLGVIFMELAALCAACAFLLIGKIGMSVHSISVMAWFHLLSASTSIVPMAVGFPKPVVLDLRSADMAFLSGIVVVSLTGQLFLTHGVQICSGAKGATLNTTQVIYSHILGFLLLGERPSLLGLAGTVLVSMGAILVAKGKRAVPTKGQSLGENGEGWQRDAGFELTLHQEKQLLGQTSELKLQESVETSPA